MTTKSDFLRAAISEKTLVTFSSRFEDCQIQGYVVAMGATFFVLALVSDRVRFDGFECFRVADICKPQPNTKRAFIESALKARGEAAAPCLVDPTSLESLLASAKASFPLVTIHEERLRPEECRIGRLLAIERGWLSLLEINPDAIWDIEPTRHRLSDITRINFDGDYERALYLVGGEPA